MQSASYVDLVLVMVRSRRLYSGAFFRNGTSTASHDPCRTSRRSRRADQLPPVSGPHALMQCRLVQVSAVPGFSVRAWLLDLIPYQCKIIALLGRNFALIARPIGGETHKI